MNYNEQYKFELKVCRNSKLVKVVKLLQNLRELGKSDDEIESFIKKADLVTMMKEKKHYYHKGVKAREGIEK